MYTAAMILICGSPLSKIAWSAFLNMQCVILRVFAWKGQPRLTLLKKEILCIPFHCAIAVKGYTIGAKHGKKEDYREA